MSRKQRMQNVREAKDRRAKKLAIGGGVVLALLLAWELPHYLGGKKSSATPPATTTAVGSTTTPGTTTPTTTPGVVPTAVPASSTGLPNSDVPPRHGKGQVAGFSTFASKDPFVPQVSSTPAPTGTGSTSTQAPAASSPTSSGPVVTSVRTLAHSGAVTISVNGKRESVRVGTSFPSSNPIFTLVSLSRGGARIGIANGSYASGAQTIVLSLNRTVTLVDTANNVHYKLRLVGS
jgi:hypothetical protein